MDWVLLNICDVSQLEENSCWESELEVKVLGILQSYCRVLNFTRVQAWLPLIFTNPYFYSSDPQD